MFRLHNLSNESKIDWLAYNGKLNDKKIFISPCTEESISIGNFIRDKYGFEVRFVDDETHTINPTILKWDEIDYIRGECVFLLTKRAVDMPQGFKRLNVNDADIFGIRHDPLNAQDALLKCLGDNRIKTVLDVGCGKGNHSKIFLEHGKIVTGIDLGWEDFYKINVTDRYKNFTYISDEFESHHFNNKYDLVWCSHALEHQRNIGVFISKIFDCCADNGQVAITVPANGDGIIVYGHISMWNAGILLYNIIAAGYDCSLAAVKTYAYNVSVIVPKMPISNNDDYHFRNVRDYFPNGLKLDDNGLGGIKFDGNIREWNWDHGQR